MTTLLDQFIAEGAELLDDATSGLLELERRPHDVELLNDVFRAAHTFKGSSGLFEHPELTSVVHAAEDVLDGLRRQQVEMDGQLVDDVIAALDLARTWLAAIEDGGSLPGDAANTAATCIARLNSRLVSNDPEPVGAPAADRPPAPWALALALATPAIALARSAGTPVTMIRYAPERDCFFRGDDPLGLVGSIPSLLHLEIHHDGDWPPLDTLDEYACVLRFELATTASAAVLEDLLRYVQEETELVALPAPEAAPTSPVARILLDAQQQALAAPCPPEDEALRLRAIADTVQRALAMDGRTADDVLPGGDALLASADRAGLARLLEALTPRPGDRAPDQPATPGSAPEPAPVARGSTDGAGRAIKVDQHKIDHLLELVGELVVAKNALPFLARSAEQGDDARTLARSIKDQHVALNRLTEELQAAAMDMRMLPVSVVFGRFPRMVRDTARKLGKEIRLETSGEETAADKNVLEQLADPLVHLVRNSLDHGLETPAQRVAAGKPAEGTITLTATQQPDGVLIELRDDGRGIDPSAIRRSAYAKGLITEEEADSLDEAASRELLFRPGFSTAEEVSDLSGRGVGMDAVRTAIVRLGGSVSLDSTLGSGTSVRLRLPLTMAVTKVMVVTAGGQQFGVPVDVVRETVRMPRAQLQAASGQPVTVRRGAVVPIVDLARALQLPTAPPTPDEDEDDVRLLVVRLGSTEAALVVEAFEEHLDVIVKPLEGVLAGMPGLAGSSLLGDGSVLLILNIQEVLGHADPAR